MTRCSFGDQIRSWFFRISGFFIALVLVAHIVDAQVQIDPATSAYDPRAWDPGKARGNTREIDFTTNEGTWMSVDISPDGRRLVFDLLAHIYVIPVSGGKARNLTQDSGVAINYLPRWSPDGKLIAFISDRGGQEALWVMHADGSLPRLVFQDFQSRITEPAWSPDGKFIYATRRLPDRGFHEFKTELWRFPLDGSAPGRLFEVQESSHVGAPEPGPDGRYVYFHRYKHWKDYLINLARVDLNSGTVQDISPVVEIPLYGLPRPGELAPKPSPDGRYLAFVRKIVGSVMEWRGHRYGPRSALWLRDLSTGEERLLLPDVTIDAAGFLSKHKRRIFPDYNWTRDGRHIALTLDGKLALVDVKTGERRPVPFAARVQRTISEQARGNHRIDQETVVIRNPRWPASSPDGKYLIFEANARLWLRNNDNGEIRRLTDTPDDRSVAIELTPAWSPDGRWIYYATWDDQEKGHIWRIALDGSAPEQITREADQYLYPFARNDRLIVSRWPSNLTAGVGDPSTIGWDILAFPLAGGAPRTLVINTLAADGGIDTHGRIYSQGLNQQLSATVEDWPKDTMGGAVSPDGRLLAYRIGSHIWFTPFKDANTAFADRTALSGTRISEQGGNFIRWVDAGTVEWFEGNQHLRFDTRTGQRTATTIDLTLPANVARGSLLFKNARLVTLDKKRTVIEKGDLLVRDGRIVAVGKVPKAMRKDADKIINASGTTIVPGWIDTHSHYLDGFSNLRQQNSTAALCLAMGVTTAYEPGNETPYVAMNFAESVATGRRVGSRVFLAGQYIYGWANNTNVIEKLSTYADIVRVVDRQVDLGAIQLKDYRVDNRIQRQMLIDVARRRGVSVTNEGDGLEAFLAMMMDGSTGMEHWLQYFPTYSDVTRFLGAAETHYSPQLWSVDYKFGPADRYWIGVDKPWANDKLQRFLDWRFLSTRRYLEYPLESFAGPLAAETAKDIVNAGGYYVTGSHSEVPGIDFHYEMWTYGFAAKPMDVLYAASLHAAHMLGLEHELGSLEAGKIADFVVLNSNVLKDIRKTRDIRLVVKDGRVYDGNSADEIWPTPRVFRGNAVQVDVFARD